MDAEQPRPFEEAKPSVYETLYETLHEMPKQTVYDEREFEEVLFQGERHANDIEAAAYDLVSLCEGVDDLLLAVRTVNLEYRRRFNAADGYVYVLKSDRFYKIGRTVDPESRISWIKLQPPQPVDEIHVFLCENMVEVESYFHRRFKNKRTNGEWFELDDSDLSYLMRFEGRGILYHQDNDLDPEPWDPPKRPELSDKLEDRFIKKMLAREEGENSRGNYGSKGEQQGSSGGDLRLADAGGRVDAQPNTGRPEAQDAVG